jgi:hypothetical protein
MKFKNRVQNPKIIKSGLLMIVVLLLAACSPAVDVPMEPTPGIPVTGPGEVELPANVSMALAARFNVSLEELVVSGIIKTDWPNACLGFADAEEMCAEVITPGYGGIIEIADESYTFRANEDGSVIKVLPQAVMVVRENLAEKLGLSTASVTLVEIQGVEWPDSCLGIVQEEVMCAQVITPGFRVVMEAEGQMYTYRTNLDASLTIEE